MKCVFVSRMVVVCLATALASAAHAQQGTADLRGRVTDAQQAALPGVAIVVRNQDSGLYRETASGPDGSFFFSAMTPGTYEVEATLAGFRKYQQRGIRLEVGRTASIDVPLEVGALEEAVEVSGQAPLIDTTSKEIGGHLSAQEVVDTPSFNRNFASYLGLLPGVVASISTSTFGADSISVAGQNVRNVNYTMDGSNNNDTFNGGNGGAQARVPLEAIQEFQLLTSQFDAEYGLASGGIVNSVSKTGTNQFHGSAFAFFQDESLTSLDYFAREQGLDKAPTKQQQFGGTVGGPILRDHAHFFVSIERIILDNGVTVNVPSRPDLNRADFERTRVWNTFVRGDQQITRNHTWGIRWLRETSPQPVQLSTSWTPSRSEAEDDTDWTLLGNLSSVLGATRVNTFRVSAVKEDVFFGNPNFNSNGHDQKSLLPTLNYLSFSDQQAARANRRLDVAYGADNVFAWFVPNKAGDHDLKFGVNYLYSSLRVQDFGNMNGTFTFRTDLPFDPANPRTYPERLTIRVPAASDFYMKGHFIGLFAQDKWKMANRLTLSLGLRYDLEILPTPNPQNPLYADDPDGYPMDTNNVSPRLGFAYALDEAGRSALRGGFGMFFQRTSYTFLTPMFANGRYSSSFTASFPTNNVDQGPRNGQFPTDPMLVNGPTVSHAAIDALFPPGTLQRNVGTVRFDSPDRQVAWSRQYSLGYERQVGASMGLSVDYVRSEQRRQYVLMDLNPALRSTGLVATGTVTRTNPLVGAVGEFASAVNTLVNAGWITYNSIQVSGTKRFSHGYSARMSYAFSRGRGNVPTGQADTASSQYLDQLRLDRDVGPTNVDRPHILSLTGAWDVPRTGGLRVSGVFQWRSGTPFTLIDTNLDADQNGTTSNEYLAAGSYSGTGQDAVTIDYKGGRNGARGPNYAELDVRAGYRIRLRGGRTIDAFIDVFNVTNEPNFENPTGDRASTANFLRYTSTVGGPTRTAQLNLRFAF